MNFSVLIQINIDDFVAVEENAGINFPTNDLNRFLFAIFVGPWFLADGIVLALAVPSPPGR